MDNLLELFRTRRAEICDAFSRRISGSLPLKQGPGRFCEDMIDVILACHERDSRSPAQAWARKLAHKESELSLEQIFASLKCLERSVRFHLLREVVQKKSLLAALAALDDFLDLLRTSCASVISKFDGSAVRFPIELGAIGTASDDFIGLADLQGTILYLNEAGRKMVGLPLSENIEPKSLHSFYTDKSWQEIHDVALAAVREHGNWEGHSRLKHFQTGEEIDVSTKVFVVKSPQTQLHTGLAVFHRSGGDSKVLEGALAEVEARKKTILESSLDPIITIDHNGLVSEFNRAAELVFGHPRETVLGKPPSEVLFPPAKIAGYQNRIDRYLEAGEGSMLGKRTEVTAIRANGESFPAEVAMSISQQSGSPVLTFFVRDISLQKQAEEEQIRYSAELERSNKELERFAYVASHDLQEPLRKILTFGDRLEISCGESLEERDKECLSRMQNAAKRMHVLINDLLLLSRVTTKEKMFERVDLAKVVKEVVSDLEVKIEQTGARVEVGKMPIIMADAVQIRQLFQNLMVNALKFRREEVLPVVKISARFLKIPTQRVGRRSNADEKCRILVEDNGIGFDEKYKERIFTIFQRLHTRDVYEGTGVGLAICRKIVERHNGTIVAHGELGKGATFEIVLPVIPK